MVYRESLLGYTIPRRRIAHGCAMVYRESLLGYT